mgnify:CR=1 FL=1
MISVNLKIKDVIFANSQIEMADGDIQARMLHLPARMRFAAALVILHSVFRKKHLQIFL